MFCQTYKQVEMEGVVVSTITISVNYNIYITLKKRERKIYFQRFAKFKKIMKPAKTRVTTAFWHIN